MHQFLFYEMRRRNLLLGLADAGVGVGMPSNVGGVAEGLQQQISQLAELLRRADQEAVELTREIDALKARLAVVDSVRDGLGQALAALRDAANQVSAAGAEASREVRDTRAPTKASQLLATLDRFGPRGAKASDVHRACEAAGMAVSLGWVSSCLSQQVRRGRVKKVDGLYACRADPPGGSSTPSTRLPTIRSTIVDVISRAGPRGIRVKEICNVVRQVCPHVTENGISSHLTKLVSQERVHRGNDRRYRSMEVRREMMGLEALDHVKGGAAADRPSS